MFLYILLLLAGLSYAEIYVLIAVGAKVGAFSTIALTLLTAIVGGSLVRSQGLQTAFAAQNAMNRGEAPAQQMLEGLMLIIAGVLLFMPGFITDSVGMLLLIPALRGAAAQRLIVKGYMQSVRFRRPPGGGSDSDVYEGEFERKDDNDHDRLN
ncbi:MULTISPECIES: FxsA family protein [Aliagarivorans]|uniref:FxsA family protein n=1 Tax=Aliagarivorans TaxID=882379 RepID=UPI000402AE53|nr:MULTISPECIES: FxsA family protein [Aliagarivorans]